MRLRHDPPGKIGIGKGFVQVLGKEILDVFTYTLFPLRFAPLLNFAPIIFAPTIFAHPQISRPSNFRAP